jgi:hypothetical protein
MATEYLNTYIANEVNLNFFTDKPVRNTTFVFTYDDDTDFDFPGGIGSVSLQVWEDDEDGKRLYNWTTQTEITVSGNVVFLNTADLNLEAGKYYYELGYVTTGGYEILLMFGEAKFQGR